MGGWHAHACHRAGGRVAAVVDVNLNAAQRLGVAVGGAAAAVSLDTVSDDVTLDVVHVCTPLHTHAEQIRAALSRGCPVIVEKPLAPTAAITEELIAEASRAKTWIQPVHQTVFQDGVSRALRWATDGPLRAFDYLACSAGSAVSPGNADEIVADILPHPLSLLDVMLRDALEAMQWETHRTAPGELLVTAVTGATAVRFFISMHVRPTRHELVLFGDEGTVTADLFHGFAWRERGHVSRMGKIVRPFVAAAAASSAAAMNLGRRARSGEPAYPGLNTLVTEVYAALDDPARRPLSDRHTLAVARARDRILHQLVHD
jgi:predicted dehydrogenase